MKCFDLEYPLYVCTNCDKLVEPETVGLPVSDDIRHYENWRIKVKCPECGYEWYVKVVAR